MTIRAIFMGRVLARIYMLLKKSRFWLFALHAGRSLCDIHESYREQSRWLLMLSNLSRAYLGVFF